MWVIESVTGRLLASPALPVSNPAELVERARAADEARAPALPDTPTFDEAGVRGVVSNSWFGFVARSGRPPVVLEILETAINQVLGEDATAARFAQVGVLPHPMDPPAFAEFPRPEFDRNARIIHEAGVSLDRWRSRRTWPGGKSNWW